MDRKRAARDQETMLMDTLWQDLRYAVRSLRRSPGFAVVAVLTLGLGIGANSAIFSVVNGVLLRSLPFEEPDRLVRLYTAYPGDDGRYPLSPPDFMSFHEEADVFSDVAAYAATRQILTERGEPTRLEVGLVSSDFFELVGATPVVGRTFRFEENEPGLTSVAVLGHRLWTQRFGGDPGVVGQTVTLDGVSREVVGVLPEGFDFPAERDVYYPLTYGPTFSATTAEGRRGEYLGVVARLTPEVSLERAEAAVGALSDRLRQSFPDTNAELSIAMIPLREHLLGDIRTPLIVLLGAVGFVLLIACANVANLLLGRAAMREGDLAVRTALGARRIRLIRQLLTESTVLGMAGGMVGLLLAMAGTRAVVAARPAGIPRLEQIGVDANVILFTVTITLLTVVIFGLVPAIQGTRGDLTSPLKESGRGALSGRGGSRMRGGLVVVEMAVAVMLLIGAGLLVRSFLQLTAVDPGIRAERTASFDVSLPESRYDDVPDVRAFYHRLFERLRGLPNVHSVGATTGLPLRGGANLLTFEIEGREPPPSDRIEDLRVTAVTPEYLSIMGVRVVRGRGFNDRDRVNTPPVVLLNETAVRRFLPGQDPVGRRVWLDMQRDGVRAGGEVVGVFADVKQQDLGQDVRPEIYLLWDQFPIRAMSVVVRSAGDPLTLADVVRREVRALDASLPVEEFTTVEQVLARSVAQPRFYMALFTIFAALALVLAAVGIFGVLSHSVAQRTREIGIRMALGGSAGDVLRLVVGRALVWALTGIGLGLLGAFGLSRILSALLYNIAPSDLITYAAVPVILLAVAALASYLPARRATAVDPMIALQNE